MNPRNDLDVTDARGPAPANELSGREASGFAETARQRAIEAYEQARENVTDAGRKAADTLNEAPLIALAGGIAAGALIAALLPRTQKETELVEPAARRVKDTARAAARAARETGTRKLDELGLSREKGGETIRSLLSEVGEAVKSSADSGDRRRD